MFKKEKDNKTTNETRVDLEQENEELYEQLTNKNQDYFFQLDSRLQELSYDISDQIIIMNQMLKEAVEFQEDAKTARKVYGTVTERADKIVSGEIESQEEESEVSPPLHLYLDGALLLGGLFSLVNGITALRTPEMDVSLLQLIMNFLLGGLVVLILVKYRPDSGEKKGMFQYILVTVATMLVWVYVITAIQMLPASTINPILPDFLVLAIGAGGLFARWRLKEKLNIKGTIF